MANPSEFREVIRRYAGLIEAQLRAAGEPSLGTESATSIDVARGAIYAQVLLPAPRPEPAPLVERLIEVSGSGRLSSLAVIDRAGHHRPVYRPLLVYSWLQAFNRVYETLPRAQFGRWEEGLRAWADVLEAELGTDALPTSGAIPAARGAAATEKVWGALALHVAGKIFIRDAWTDLASDTFGRLSRAQQTTGAFLLTDASDNPETHWYHELILLHAAASYAVQTEDRKLAGAVARNAMFHQNETQPDHATTQPWGLFAFIWTAETRPLADGMLHAIQTQAAGTSTIEGVSLMLLADALYCLRLFV